MGVYKYVARQGVVDLQKSRKSHGRNDPKIVACLTGLYLGSRVEFRTRGRVVYSARMRRGEKQMGNLCVQGYGDRRGVKTP